MGLFRAKSKKSIGIFLFWNISFPQKLHPKTFSIKPDRTGNCKHLNTHISQRISTSQVYKILLNGAIKITNTIHNMQEAALIFLRPLQQLSIRLCSLSHIQCGMQMLCNNIQKPYLIYSEIQITPSGNQKRKIRLI